ncbi:hypothetical protein [Maridesulfovibrio sp.]|uniref:hypothetical protein n=1 Tax=Maridesulfovibrio sp. TaxID=2795000 RepID=UPI002A188EF0|nr:hypothetical protein [Maridesulfovibrio sp.]
MYTSALLSGTSTASSYFTNISNNSTSSKTPTISSSMSPTQIRRQLQMQFASMSFGLTSDEQQQVNSYYSQLNGIYGVDETSVRKEEEERLGQLKSELNKLYGISDEPKELTQEEQDKIDEIQNELDELYHILPTKEPEGAERRRAESLKWELKKLYYPEGKTLTAAEKKKEESIQAELKELFGIEGPKTLTAEEQAKADELNDKIDEIMGTKKKELTPAEEEKADAIITEMEEIVGSLVTHGLSNVEKKLFHTLDKQAEDLKLTAKERDLTDSEQNKLAELNKNINTLLEKAAAIQDQQDAQAKQVHSQVSGFFSQLGTLGGGTLLSRTI